MTYNEYRSEILLLDRQIAKEDNPEKLIVLIDKNIELNRKYIKKLGASLPFRYLFLIVFIFFTIGLFMIPSIAVRRTKIRICKDRIKYLEKLKDLYKNSNNTIVDDKEKNEYLDLFCEDGKFASK